MVSGEVSPSSCSSWSREQEKAFENALATYDESSNDRWEKIAADVPGKTVEEIKHHFELLVEDIDGIESGHVPLPCYISSPEKSADHGNDANATKKSRSSGLQRGDSGSGRKGSRSDLERRKGTAWTEDEHRLFLLGLEKYGKGDWRSISRNFVITRTPTQVASHAQKYFIRLNSMNKDRRRTSIHDITTIGGGELSAPQGPITGQTNGTVAPPMKYGKPSHQLSGTSGPGVYGTPTIGQPIGGPIMPAVGTPVKLPAAPHMVYGVHTAFPRTSVSGAPFRTPAMDSWC